MGIKFWLVRALKIFIVVTVLLFMVELLKQHSVQDALIFACTWSLITTVVFIGSRLYQSNKGVACAICNDIPDNSDKNT